MIKRFKSDYGSKIKIIIDPVLGFSDLIHFDEIGNTCFEVSVECKNIQNGSVEKHKFEFDYNGATRTLSPNVDFVTNIDFPMEITINSIWHFRKELKETLTFIFEG